MTRAWLLSRFSWLSGVAAAATLTGCCALGGSGGGAGTPSGGGGGGGGGGASLSRVGSVPVTAAAQVLADPSGKYAYALDPSKTRIDEFAINNDGSLTALTPASVGNSGLNVNIGANAHTANGSFLYATTGSKVNQFQIGANGQLSALSPPTVPTGPASLAAVVDPTNHFVYVADSASGGGVDAYKINTDGTLTSLGLTSTDPASQLGVTADGKWLYSNSLTSNSNHINAFQINADGTLTSKGQVRPGSPELFVANPKLPVLYILDYNNGSEQVVALTVNSDGTLTQLGQPVPVAGQPLNLNPMVISPGGSAIYVPSRTTAEVTQIGIAADGSLSARNPPTVAADGVTTSASLTPDGKHLFVTTNSDVEVFATPAGG